MFKDQVISKIGIYNQINFSRSLWEYALNYLKTEGRRLPAAVGHDDWNYNPTDIAQQKAIGFYKDLRITCDDKILSDLDAGFELAQAIENEELWANSIHGRLVNSWVDEEGIRQAEGMILQYVSFLGRDQPAVAEAQIYLSQEHKADSASLSQGLKNEISFQLNLQSQDKKNKTLQEEDSVKKVEVETTKLKELIAKAEAYDKLNLTQPDEEKFQISDTTPNEINRQQLPVTLTAEQVQATMNRLFEFSTASALALSQGRILPARLEQMSEQIKESKMSEDVFKIFMKELTNKEVSLSDKPMIAKEVRQAENNWQDIEEIDKEIRKIMLSEKISYHHSAEKFYQEHPEAKKY